MRSTVSSRFLLALLALQLLGTVAVARLPAGDGCSSHGVGAWRWRHSFCRMGTALEDPRLCRDANDTRGSVPGEAYQEKPRRDPQGGPPGRDDSFHQIDEPLADQWTYHAVADIVLANSFLRSLPGVDPHRIGITGISWGCYLAAGVDGRFRFAIPVYGCGFLGEDSAWLPDFAKMGVQKASRWLRPWDPSVYFPGAHMAMLWVSGSNVFAYPLPSLQKSYRLPRAGPPQLAVRLRMPHGHKEGANPEKIRVFADAILRGGPKLIRVTGRETSGPVASVSL